jgi:hypothetical protein
MIHFSVGFIAMLLMMLAALLPLSTYSILIFLCGFITILLVLTTLPKGKRK